MQPFSVRKSAKMSARMSVRKSLDLYAHASEIIPGGTQCFSRRPSSYVPGVTPVYFSRGKGAHVWDLDGNEYIDLVMSAGAVMLGYADDEVDDAVCRQIRGGTVYSMNQPLEVELAEELIATVPCAEMVRFAHGGGEANAIAVRIARGYTGREKVVFCGYHGWHDWYLAAGLLGPDTLNAHLVPGIEPKGVPASLQGTTIPFEFNNLDSLRQTLEANRGQIACIIMEAARGVSVPQPGFLEGVRRLADEHEIVLIFDEVVTGFHLAIGGAQQHFRVIPDMATFAKAISNGYTMGAVCGRRKVMSAAADMFISSTYWSDTVGTRAALETIRAMKRRDAQTAVWKKGERFQAVFNGLAARYQVPAESTGLPSLPAVRFMPSDPAFQKPLFAYYQQELTWRGIFAGGGANLCHALTDSDLTRVEQALDEVFPLLADALREGDIGNRLEGQVGTPAFRRLVG